MFIIISFKNLLRYTLSLHFKVCVINIVILMHVFESIFFITVHLHASSLQSMMHFFLKNKQTTKKMHSYMHARAHIHTHTRLLAYKHTHVRLLTNTHNLTFANISTWLMHVKCRQ